MAAFGSVIAVSGGAAAVAFLFFRFLGEKWLNAKFEERLATYRHVQQQELERLKLKINTLMDRTTKLHQREFEILPEVWAKLADAHATIVAFTSPLQSSHDVNRMSSPHLEEFLKDNDLMEWQKAELREAKDKTKYYREAIYWHKLHNAKETLRIYHIYLKKNGIFIPEPLKSSFTKMDDLLWHTLLEHEHDKEHGVRPRQRNWHEKLDEEGDVTLKLIEDEVQSRLWSQHATDV
ncbi:hypothetical protein AB4Y85_18130 [Microvirga sp. 2YAF29]